MTTFEIPKEWRELSERKAAHLAGISRTTLRNRHIVDGCEKPMSLVTRDDDTTYIPLEEIKRLYNETALKNLRNILENNEVSEKPEDSLVQKPGYTTQNVPERPEDQLKDQLKNQFITMTSEAYLSLSQSLKSLKTELEQEKIKNKDLEATLTEEKQRAEKYYDEMTISLRLLESKSQTIDQLTSKQGSHEKSWWKKLFG